MGEVKAINTIHRLLLGAAFTGGALFVVSLATDNAAHAADKPAVVSERPGGALGDLPSQASDVAQDVVNEVVPDKPKPKPTKKPTKPPADEPTPPPSTSPVEDVLNEADDELEEVGEVIPTPTVPVPIPTPRRPAPIPTPTLPIQDPPTSPVTLPAIPAPTSPQPQQTNLPAPAVTPPPPAALAELLGPTATPAEPTPALTDDDPLVPALIASLIGAADCYTPLNDPRHNATDSKTPSGADRHAGRVQQQHSLGQPCPGHPGAPNTQAITTLTVKPPPPDGQQLVADSAAGTYSPALQRLYTLRPRGDLPAGRWPLVEPGPA